jgi:hypothetical protein
VWTVEQSQEYAAANSALHAALVGHEQGDGGAESTGDGQAELAAAKARFDRIANQLQAARYAKNRLGGLLFRGGMAVAAVSGLGYLATRGA